MSFVHFQFDQMTAETRVFVVRERLALVFVSPKPSAWHVLGWNVEKKFLERTVFATVLSMGDLASTPQCHRVTKSKHQCGRLAKSKDNTEQKMVNGVWRDGERCWTRINVNIIATSISRRVLCLFRPKSTSSNPCIPNLNNILMVKWRNFSIVVVPLIKVIRSSTGAGMAVSL